ncbi:MAG: hypothetical protein AB8H03_05695 [Saprospiraceae bacterium]
MKKYSNPSRYFYVDVSILLCLIYLMNTTFISIEVLKEIENVGEVRTSIFENINFNFKEFFYDVGWYLFIYILLEVSNKVLSLIEILAKIVGNPIKVNIKLLNKYCTLLLLLLSGKFLIFIITSLF